MAHLNPILSHKPPAYTLPLAVTGILSVSYAQSYFFILCLIPH